MRRSRDSETVMTGTWSRDDDVDDEVEDDNEDKVEEWLSIELGLPRESEDSEMSEIAESCPTGSRIRFVTIRRRTAVTKTHAAMAMRASVPT